MAIATNSYSLADYALNSNDPLVKKISYSLLENGSILQDIPFRTRQILKALGARYQKGGLPTVNWRPLNTEPQTVKATPTPFEEQAFVLSNTIDVDTKLLQDKSSIQNPFSTQMDAYLRSATYDMNDKWINNDHVSGDPNAIVGLKYRIANPSEYGTESELLIDAGVDLSGTITAANANKFLETLEQLLQYLGAPEGDGCVIYVNDILKRKINSAVRILGAGAGFRIDKDAFDRQISMYQNAVIRDIGRKADQSTRIISQFETSNGLANTGSTYTSMYGVRFAQENAMRAWQFSTMEDSVQGPYLLPSGVQQRVVIDWAIGLFQESTRCIGRVFDIKLA